MSYKENFLNMVNAVLSYTGIMGVANEIKRSSLWLTKIGRVCFVTTTLTQIVTLFASRGDTQKLFECFSVFSFCCMGLLKMFSLYINRRNWKSLFNKITAIEQKETGTRIVMSENNSVNKTILFHKHIRLYTKKFVFTSKNIIRVYCFTAILFILSPFVERAVNKVKGYEIAKYPHILPGWSPLDFSIFGYLITIMLETVGAVYCVCVHIAFDVTSVAIMMFACGQFSLIRDYSEAIGGNSSNYTISPERDIAAHNRIVQCHCIHNSIVSLVADLDKLLKNILGVYFFIATLTLCSVALRLKSETLSVMELLSLVQYMGASLLQLFLYCHYGDAVLHQSSINMGCGPFGATWWILKPRTRRELMLLAYGMSRPCRLSAGYFNLLDLPSFVLIVRAAYSYYAVVRQKSD